MLLKAYSYSIFITHPLLISISAFINKQTNMLSASFTFLGCFACEADESNSIKHQTQAEFGSAQREEETVRNRGSSFSQTYFLSDLNTSF